MADKEGINRSYLSRTIRTRLDQIRQIGTILWYENQPVVEKATSPKALYFGLFRNRTLSPVGSAKPQRKPYKR